MPYIVKSSLEIGSTIMPWNEQESNKLMNEKKEYLEKKAIEEVKIEEEPIQEEVKPEVEEAKEENKNNKNNKKNQKAGEK